ncbi:Arginine--tRNA ligase, partial [Frankliniella fusca]
IRIRQCEAVLEEMAGALEKVRRTAEALETRRRVVKAAQTVTAERALKEYDEFLGMLRALEEAGRPRPDLPVLRHVLDVETVRARVSMVQGSLLAMSQEVLSLSEPPTFGDRDSKVDVLSSLRQHRKSYTHMSEELLTLLDERASEHASDRFSAAGKS